MTMILDFPIFKERLGSIKNYDLYMMPKGVYRAASITADNYLFPMYFFKEGDDHIVSTSVYALINYKKRFIRNTRFHTTDYFRPTFMTLDQEIMRKRTEHRRSSMELTKKQEIVDLGARLIQEYVTEMEERFPDHVHIVQMGGKDSENIVLAERRKKWIVMSGEPNASLNERFISDNGISIEEFVRVTNRTDNSMLLEEVIASDCMYDVCHFRWVRTICDIAKKHGGKAVLWIGSDGDGIFARNNNHRDKDYYATHDLHVGMSMGIWHQMFKNLLDIPVVSPYQSPRFLDELFYRFDPYFVVEHGDVRSEIGEILYGRPVKYPSENPTPLQWERSRFRSIPAYIEQLKKDGVECRTKPFKSWTAGSMERIGLFLNKHSNKRRTRLSRVLFPLRREIGKVIPALKSKRGNVASREIR